MITGHRRMNFKMIQKLYAVSGIFRSNQIHLPQSIYHPKRNILQISNWCCTQIQFSQCFIHNPPTLHPQSFTINPRLSTSFKSVSPNLTMFPPRFNTHKPWKFLLNKLLVPEILLSELPPPS